MDVRGDTTAGAQAARSLGMHLQPLEQIELAGSDPKSQAIAAAAKGMMTIANAQIGVYNTSVDQLRQGVQAAADRMTAADQHGAELVNGVRTI